MKPHQAESLVRGFLVSTLYSGLCLVQLPKREYTVVLKSVISNPKTEETGRPGGSAVTDGTKVVAAVMWAVTEMVLGHYCFSPPTVKEALFGGPFFSLLLL